MYHGLEKYGSHVELGKLSKSYCPHFNIIIYTLKSNRNTKEIFVFNSFFKQKQQFW